MWPFNRKPRERAISVGYVPSNAIGNTGNPWGSLDPGWQSISPQAAEALAACASCVSLIAETIAALPAVVALADQSRKVQPEHPLSRLVVEGCNEVESWSELVATLLASTLLRGNGLAEIGTDERGNLVSLTSVPFEHCTPWLSKTGELRFDYMPMTPPNVGRKRTLLRSEVVLIKDRSDAGILGVPRLQRSANAVQHAIRTQTSSFQWMANSARPGGTLNAPGRVSEPVMKRLQQDWDNNYSGERFGKTAVLPEGMTFAPLGWFNAADGQVVERLAYSVLDICRLFGVLNFLLGGEKTTFASANAALSYFSANTLRPWIAKLERSIQTSLLEPRLRFQIDAMALLKADPDAFAAALLKTRQAGVITANECRAMLSLPPHADGDDLTPPSVISPDTPKPEDPKPEPAPPPADKSKLNGHARHA